MATATYECVETISLENLHKLIESTKVSLDHKVFLRKLQTHMKKVPNHSLTFQTNEKIAKL